MTLSFEDAFARLAARPPVAGTTWSLEPTRRLLEHLGRPDSHFPTIHIGGTNGKGSVCALLDAALSAAGLRVGRYTSPHLVDVRERMLVGGLSISRAAFAEWAERVLPLAEDLNASFFEATTAIAFADFAARGVDIAVVEVGLGGRLDSTNVITPLVSAVTRISRDHTEYLGDSLASIAREKAGIAKQDVTFIVGEQDAGLAGVLVTEGNRRGARVRVIPPELQWRDRLSLSGRHQRRNAAVAAAVLEMLPGQYRPSRSVVKAAFAAATLPGRFDRRGKWIFDVAHNASGIDALAVALADARPERPLHALVGILGDKDWDAMLERLSGVVDRIVITDPPGAPHDRRWDSGSVASTAGVDLEPDFERALHVVQQDAATVLVTGSFHTVGDALARLPGFAPLG